MKIEKLVMFASGVLVGGSLAYIFLREKIRREVEKGNTELLDAIQQSMEDRYSAMYARKEEEKEKKEEEKERPDTKPKSSIQKPSGNAPVVTYNKLKEQAEDILSEYNTPFTDEVPKKEPVKGDGPYMMCYEDMMEQDVGYNTLVCHYYPDNEDFLVTDDHGYPIEDAKSVIGIDNLIYLRDEDKDVIYVRNDYTSVDYEVFLNSELEVW